MFAERLKNKLSLQKLGSRERDVIYREYRVPTRLSRGNAVFFSIRRLLLSPTQEYPLPTEEHRVHPAKVDSGR